jgi:alginate O-acetyltransferase complex protein AlgI
MIFASSVFLYVFLPAFLLLYFVAPRSLRTLTIALGSYFFYGWWRPPFVILMLVSTVVDYLCGNRIAAAKMRGGRGRGWLLCSLITNLGLLGYFKYANFGVATFNALLASWGFEEVRWTAVILPVGISFYTFQTLSYTIDVYRGEVAPSKRFTDFMAYVAMFPQLVAGPIVRYRDMEKQLQEFRPSWSWFDHGVLLFQCGLVKKVLIADMLDPVAREAFAGTHALGAIDAWTGVLAFTLQLYFDFSGYSDMAIGLGLMLGFRFPINFDGPYRSVSVTEFWRRWHISLSTWLRDYLYISLGGNRKGRMRTYVNLMLTMLLGGLWHGANWTFIAWGGYQGFWLVVERLAGGRPFYALAPRAVRVAVTFLIVVVGWVFFKAATIGDAADYLGWMAGTGTQTQALGVQPLAWTAFVAGLLVAFLFPTSQVLAERRRWWWVLVVQLLFVLALLQLHYKDHVPFLYYQF